MPDQFVRTKKEASMYQPLRLALLVAAVYSASVFAQAKPIDIPAQSLGDALTTLAAQSGIQILFNADEVRDAKSTPLHGQLAPEDALRKLLEGSGMIFSPAGKGAFVVQRRPVLGSATPSLPAVRVVADAYTYKPEEATVAGKVPLALREIPNSVSVITRQQMDDQDMITMGDAMQQATGITVVANDTTNNQYWSRGYGLGVMYDGVPSYNGMTPSHQFDLALYERIEVLRGPAGLLRGVGEPGGLVNLVKKRPEDTFHLAWTATAGSWSNYRAETDITGPLNADKTLRGRLVLTDEDRGYFYDRTHGKKWVGLGALEYAPTAQTTFSLSYAAQDQNVKAPWSGLPVYLADPVTGIYPLLDVPPSTNPRPDWGRMRYHTEETSLSAEHRFDNKWLVKARVSHRTRNQYYNYGYTSSALNPVTNLISYSSQAGDYDETRDGLDIYANGPFELFGRTHNMLFGFNSEVYENAGQSGTGQRWNDVPFGDLSTVVKPDIPYTSGSDSKTTQSGFYSQLRLSLADPLTMVLGGRVSTFKAKSRSIAPSPETAWQDGAKANNKITPYAGILYDLTKEITLYASYSDIFVPQTQLKVDGSTLNPRIGRQFEVGSKGEFFDGKLGASLALFNIRDRNRAYADPDNPTFYLNAGEIESKGWELEVTGKPVRGLDLTAGYTRLTTRYLKDKANEGLPYSIFSPKNQFKLWANYRFGNDSALSGLSAGIGVFAQSRSQSTRGVRDRILNGGYAVVNGRIAYQINKNYTVSLLINNLLDRKYYASVGTTNTYNFYGEPRSFMLTLRANY